jgi:membrane fusion protein (multidrug efflux system)
MTDATFNELAPSQYTREKPAAAIDAGAQRKRLRLRLFLGLGFAIALGAVATGAWWFEVASRYVSTDDAYVGADVAQITPEVAGTILEFPVTDTMHVKKGQLLVRLDPADTELVYSQAEANYQQTVRQVQQDFANAAQAAAQVNARGSDVRLAEGQYQDRVMLAKANAISAETLSSARNAMEDSHANLAAAQQTLAAQEALIKGGDVFHNPAVLAAKAAVDTARLNLKRTDLRAPFDGVVAEKAAQIGERVSVGQVLMTVVPVDRVYVDANFKEGQLTKVQRGQAVTLTSDLYGSGVVFHGRVMGLSGGTGSAFALIPAQNATGNWIKVVQRLPVRVALDSRELADHPLRVGLSMTATIDLSQ